LKPRAEIFNAALELVPEHWGAVENYTKALTRIPMLTLLGNGALVCAAILFFQTVFAIPCAYALAKLRFRGAEPIMALVLLGLLIPIQTTALPIYVAFSGLKLLNTLSALVIPFMLSVFAIFLFRQFFRAMPDDLIHAARLDGMGELGIVWRVIVPNAWPAATAFAIFSVVAHWNDLFWPLIVVTRMPLATPPLGLLFFRAAEAGDDYGALMAATMIVTLPLVLLFLAAQRRFIEGITLSGLKG
jgi:multiple sugar transport system permease protein